MKLKPFIYPAVLGLTASLAAAQFQPLINADLRGGYAATVGGASAGLAQGELSLVPALSSGDWSLLPTLSGSMGGQERSIDEGVTFIRSANFGFRPTLKRGAWSLRAQALRNWNLEAIGEEWGKGAYDYDQFGGGLGWEAPLEGLDINLGLNADYAHRNYMNFHNIAAAAAMTGGKNYYIKDFNVASAEIMARFAFHNLTFSYRPEWRDYTDSYVTLASGEIDLGQRQQDWLHTAGLSLGFALGETLGLDMSADFSLNDSNQSSFDLAQNQKIPDFQDFVSETLNLGFPWKADALLDGLVLTPGYQFLARQSAKPVQDRFGAYLAGQKQQDLEHTLRLDLSQSLPWGFRLVAGGSYRIARSNQDYVRGVLNNYEHWQLTAGLAFAFAPEASGAGPAAVADKGEDGMDDPDFDEEVGSSEDTQGQVALAAVETAATESLSATAAAETASAAVAPTPAPAAPVEKAVEARTGFDCAGLAEGASAADRAACGMASVAGQGVVSVERNPGGELLVRFLSGSLRFGKGNGDLNPADRALLSKLAAAVKDQPVLLEVHGFSDNSGNEGDNRWVSNERAKSVSRALASAGVEAAKIRLVKGFGSDRPVASNDTDEGRNTNRRVELLILNP